MVGWYGQLALTIVHLNLALSISLMCLGLQLTNRNANRWSVSLRNNNINQKMVASVAQPMNESKEWPSLNCRQDEWELLEQEEVEEEEALERTRVKEDSFEVIIEADTLPSTTGSRHLRHCNSSPNLSSLPDATATGTYCQSPPTGAKTIFLASVLENEEESSFAMVSGPSSVWTSASTTSNGLNFRNAILASPSSEQLDDSVLSRGVTSGVASPAPTSNNNHKKCGLRKYQPRFVVVPSPTRIRRCSLSTGDLPSLVLHEQEGEDANEFYQQKSMGLSSYSVGRKQRPDEAKRRTLIIQKKERQRQGNL